MAILTKDRAGSLRYVIPDGPVPTSISWTLYDPSGTELATAQPIAPPTSYASASAVAGTRMDEVEITLAADPTGIAVGEIVRVFDVWGRTFDCVCYGKVSATKKVRLSDCAVAIDEVANIHNPVVSIPLASSYLDDTGDGWRVDLEITQDGTTRNHALWFAVALLTVTLAISPREYMNQNPNVTRDLEALELRKDWPLLVLEAAERLEERLRTRDRWYTMVVSDTGLRRCMMTALGAILAVTNVPEGTEVLDWRNDAEARFNQAVSDMLASGYYDVDDTGTIEADEKSPPIGTSYKVL